MREWISIYFKGVFMGAADSIPGVSGGTIALITGIYERLLDAIAEIDTDLAVAFTGVHTAEGRTELTRQLQEMDVGFLLVLGAGIATAIFTMTGLVSYASSAYAMLTFVFFFGLIAASAVVLFRQVSVESLAQVGTGICGFVIAFLLSGEATGGLSHSWLVIFLVGAIAISAMILPDLSGAFLLLLFGQYNYMSDSLHGFVDASVSGNLSRAFDLGSVVTIFMMGAVIGLLTISKVISWALETYRTATLTFLVSLMVGALRLPAAEVIAAASRETTLFTWATVALVALMGGGAVLVIDYFTDDMDYETGQSQKTVAGRTD